MSPCPATDGRALADLKSVGMATLADFRLLGVSSVAALAAATRVNSTSAFAV